MTKMNSPKCGIVLKKAKFHFRTVLTEIRYLILILLSHLTQRWYRHAAVRLSTPAIREVSAETSKGLIPRTNNYFFERRTYCRHSQVKTLYYLKCCIFTLQLKTSMSVYFIYGRIRLSRRSSRQQVSPPFPHPSYHHA